MQHVHIYRFVALSRAPARAPLSLSLERLLIAFTQLVASRNHEIIMNFYQLVRLLHLGWLVVFTSRHSALWRSYTAARRRYWFFDHRLRNSPNSCHCSRMHVH